VGTTIRVEPEALDGDEAYVDPRGPDGMWPREEIDRYGRMVATSRYRTIELLWDRNRGVFTLGRKIPR
jgi:hypothetical protein